MSDYRFLVMEEAREISSAHHPQKKHWIILDCVQKHVQEITIQLIEGNRRSRVICIGSNTTA
jgi:Ethanolamine utilization protein EutJ (predicted chaperonin)